MVVGEAGYLTEFRRTLRRRRNKFDTEKAYTSWLTRFSRWAKVNDPAGLGVPEIREFLTEVALGRSPGAAGSDGASKRGTANRGSLKHAQECDLDWDIPDEELPMHAEAGCAASTQNQAKSALLYYFQTHLGRELGFIDAAPASAPPQLPVVLDRDEVMDVRKYISAYLTGLMYDSV